MRPTEFADFLKLLYCQYPGLRRWLIENSPDPSLTESIWLESLKEYSLAECKRVLRDWATAAIDPLKTYEKVTITIRQHIDDHRELDRRNSASTEFRSDQHQRIDAFMRARSTPIDTGIADAFKRAKHCREYRDRGELDPQDANRIIHDIVESIR
jgi:hypothetical protein